MGNTCEPCSERPLRPEPGKSSPRTPVANNTPKGAAVSTPKGIASPKGVARPRSASISSSLKEHDGQYRSRLQVKDGGFALRNFERRNPGKIEDFFKFNDTDTELGKGGFGTVRKAQDKRTDQFCAVKCVRKTGTKQKEHKEEIEIMRVLDHPNIVRLLESFEDSRYTYMVLELCEGGDLLETIIGSGVCTESIAAKYGKQMLLAVNYLHQNHIMHRDLKPENFLLATKEAVGEATLKLIDFGISRRFKPGVLVRTKVGTPNYVAPEVLQGCYDEKSDVWSLGVIMHVLLTGQQPFNGKTAECILAKVKSGHVCTEGLQWRMVSPAGRAFVRTILEKQPKLRPSALHALEAEWLISMPEESVEDLNNLDLSGLQAFANMHQLKRAACTVIATQLTDERIRDLKSKFMAVDQNNDGSLSVGELKAGFVAAGVECPKYLGRLFDQADTDGSGVVDYTEFLAATLDKKLYHQETTVWLAFKKFDLNGSGAIDRQELQNLMSNESIRKAMHYSGEAHRKGVEDVFSTVDTNGDDLIDFDEFFAMMRNAEGGSPRSRAGRRTLKEGSPRPGSKGSNHGTRRGSCDQVEVTPEGEPPPQSGGGKKKRRHSMPEFVSNVVMEDGGTGGTCVHECRRAQSDQ